MFRVVIGCFAVCLLAAGSLHAQKATCTNWKTFVLNPSNLNNPSEESDGVNDNHTVVGTAFYTFNKPNSRASCITHTARSRIGGHPTPSTAGSRTATFSGTR